MLGINLSLAALAVHAAAESAPRAVLSGLHDATTIAGAVGDPVASWTGSAPGGAVYSPLATAPLIGSKNGVRFIEDVGSYRPLVTAIATEKQSRRIFIVARPDAVTSLAQRPLMGVTSAANRHIGLRYNTGTPAAIGIYGSPVAAESLPAATWALIEYEITPAAVTCWIDGVEVFTAAGAPEGSVTLNTLLGGRHGGVSYRFNGAISMATEYDISPAPMSAGQIAAARAAGMFRAALLNSPELSYSLDPQDDGSFGDGFRSVGLLEVGTPLILAGPMELDNVLTVGSVFRVGGPAGEANLSFATDADHLHRAYTSAPMIDTVGVALRISVANAGVVGRIAHTSAAEALGFLLEVDAGILRVTVSDGEVTRVAERAVPAYGAPFGVAAAIGPSGLMLCAGDDGTIGDVIVTDRGLYVGPSADELFIGGAGVTIYGGSLYSPQAFDEANLIVAKNSAMLAYSGSAMGADASSLYWFAPENVVVSGGTLTAWPNNLGTGWDVDAALSGTPKPAWNATDGFAVFTGVEALVSTTVGVPPASQALLDGDAIAIFVVHLVPYIGTPDVVTAMSIVCERFNSATNAVGYDISFTHFGFTAGGAGDYVRATGRRFSPAFAPSALVDGAYGKVVSVAVVGQTTSAMTVGGSTGTPAAVTAANFSNSPSMRLGMGMAMQAGQLPLTGNIYEWFATTDTSPENIAAITAELNAKHGLV